MYMHVTCMCKVGHVGGHVHACNMHVRGRTCMLHACVRQDMHVTGCLQVYRWDRDIFCY